MMLIFARSCSQVLRNLGTETERISCRAAKRNLEILRGLIETYRFRLSIHLKFSSYRKR